MGRYNTSPHLSTPFHTFLEKIFALLGEFVVA
jgi:hypothetical protein